MGNMQRPSQTKEFSTNFACQICMNPVSEEKRFRNQKRCSHSFCIDCISYYITVTVEMKKMAQVRCPDLNCGNFLDPISCSPILPVTVFEKWCDLLCELEAFRSPWAYCPSKDCSELILDECGGNARKSRCPKCNTLFCFQCNSPWHRFYWCNEKRRMRYSNDILLTQLAQNKKWTKCPGCNCYIERAGGCSIIHCRCGTNFCHDCGEQLRPRHFFCGCISRKTNWCAPVLIIWQEMVLPNWHEFLLILFAIVFCYLMLIWL